MKQGAETQGSVLARPFQRSRTVCQYSSHFSHTEACLIFFAFSNYFLVCFDRRLEPTEKPLQIVYDYLAGLGFDDPLRMQEEAANSDLSCMIRFYSGKKLCVHTVAVPVAVTMSWNPAKA